MILAPDRVIDWSDVDGFCYKKKYDEDDFIPELDIKHFLKNLKPLNDYDAFKKEKIHVRFASTNQNIQWRVHKCLTYETDYKDSRYIFTSGRWYKIETNFFNTVVDYIKTIPISSFDFPPCDVQNEAEYNNKFTKIKDCYVLDKMLVKCEFARTPIEPCDILTKDLQFIHVKQKHNSAALSHLFSQCKISAESLIKDEGFRKAIVEEARKRNLDLSFLPLDNSFKASNCEIIIAIICKGTNFDKILKEMNFQNSYWSNFDGKYFYETVCLGKEYSWDMPSHVFKFGGYDDWRLVKEDEAKYIYNNLWYKGRAEVEGGTYWMWDGRVEKYYVEDVERN